MKRALILSGGGARGAFQVGVLIGSYYTRIADLERQNDLHPFTRRRLQPDPFPSDLKFGTPKLITVAPRLNA